MSNPDTLGVKWKPGQSGNPSGTNAISKALCEFRKYMAETPEGGQHTRLYNVWNRLYVNAIKGNVLAGKFIVEQCQGKAKETVDLLNSDLSLSAAPALTTSEIRARLEFLLFGTVLPIASKATDGPAGETAKPPTTE